RPDTPAACILHSFPTRRSSDLVPEILDRDAVPANYRHRERCIQPGDIVMPTSRRRADAADEIFPSGQIERSLGAENEAQRKQRLDRKSTRLNSSHQIISYAVFC